VTSDEELAHQNAILHITACSIILHFAIVRKTLSFSKKLANHIGALWYFVHDYNA
jgi:hypothetical protein